VISTAKAMLFLILTSGVVHAQEADTGPLITVAQCTAFDQFAKDQTTDFGNRPMALGIGNVTIITDDGSTITAGGMLSVNTNYDTQTFSISISFDKGNGTITCKLASGYGFAPFDYYVKPGKKL
jgi:hypothetical protein